MLPAVDWKRGATVARELSELCHALKCAEAAHLRALVTRQGVKDAEKRLRAAKCAVLAEEIKHRGHGQSPHRYTANVQGVSVP